jgi:hypothetical protein
MAGKRHGGSSILTFQSSPLPRSILSGEKSADVPVQAPTKYELHQSQDGYLREINAGRSVDVLPQGIYPAKMIGNDFLRFVDNHHALKSSSCSAYGRFLSFLR